MLICNPYGRSIVGGDLDWQPCLRRPMANQCGHEREALIARQNPLLNHREVEDSEPAPLIPTDHSVEPGCKAAES